MRYFALPVASSIASSVFSRSILAIRTTFQNSFQIPKDTSKFRVYLEGKIGISARYIENIVTKTSLALFFVTLPFITLTEERRIRCLRDINLQENA